MPKLLLWSLLICVSAAAQMLPGTAGNAEQAPAAPVDIRATPRSSVFSFLQAARDGDYRKAASFLNLSSRPASDGPTLARELKAVLDRKLTSDPGLLNDTAEGDPNDGLAPNLESLGSIVVGDRKIEILLGRVTREGQAVWLFSPDTVASIPQLYAGLDDRWFERSLPSWMLIEGPFGTMVYQWLALLALLGVAYGIGAIAGRLVMRVIAPLVARTRATIDDKILAAIRPPIGLLLGTATFRIGLVYIAPPVLLRAYLGRAMTAIAYVALGWLVLRIIDVIAGQIVTSMGGRQRASATSVVPLAKRTLKAAAILIVILAILDSWGFNMTAVVAGLGVGGLAVALAAQKTLENLFGGMAIASDRPVLVGDFCRFGEKVGTVEDLGLRSTRIRTLDRTVITIPNAEFSTMQLENFARRDKIWFHPVIPLRRDTTPAQVRGLIRDIREKVLLPHPKMDPDPARVRFIGIGPSSLDLEIFAYVRTSDFGEFLVYQEELLLGILELIEASGTALAMPAQLTLLGRDPMLPAGAPPIEVPTPDGNGSRG
jgi:MscS family membrane protein